MGHRSAWGRTRKNDHDEAETDSSPPSSSSSTADQESTAHRAPEDITRASGTARTSEPSARIQRAATAERVPGQRAADRSDRGYVEYDPGPDRQALADRYGLDVRDGQARTLQWLETEFGSDRVRRWAEEGMTVATMGKPRDMQAFRERQASRPEQVPTDVERRNEASAQRNAARPREEGPAGDTQVPDPVRKVVSSPGQSLDGTVQRAMEAKLGDEFGDVRIHTGPQAAEAAEQIDARAFTVGNHIAFNRGEYEPESSAGQRVLAHELTHVRQQTEGAVSMLPKAEAEPAIDPDPRLERNAEEAAREVTAEPRTIRRLGTEIHVQPKLEVSSSGDPPEREAERVAEQVMQASDERQEPPVTDEEGETASANRGASPTERERGASGGGRTTSTSRPAAPPTQDRTPRIDEPPRSGGASGEHQAGEGVERMLESASGGKPLPPATRSFFEPRFGRDFGDVRVHTGREAADLNRKLDAKAFTHGSDVYFGASEYRPGSPDGRQLIAHELTHVVQQTDEGSRAVDRLRATFIQRQDGPAATQGKSINWGSLVLEDLFKMWVENDYQHGNSPPGAPPERKVQHQVRRRLDWKVENDDTWRETFNWFLENEPNVNHANGYWLREAIRYRLREAGPGMAVSGDCVEDIDYAKLSQAVYGNDPPPGWEKIPGEDKRNKLTGFHAASYKNEKCKEKVIAFEGTISLADWANNFVQVAFARSAQYTQAMALAQKAQQNVSSETQLKFVGHSLGGGLASAASIVTGAPAVTFNAAGVRKATVLKYLLASGSWGDIPKAFEDPNVKAYYIDGEILSWLQDNTPAPAAVGERIPLEPASKEKGKLKLHSMDEVIKAMEKGKDGTGTKDGNGKEELPEGKAPPSLKFLIGDTVKTTSALRVRDGPSTDYASQATLPEGETGVVVEGPEETGAYKWWKIEYDAGYTGWSAQPWLRVPR